MCDSDVQYILQYSGRAVALCDMVTKCYSYYIENQYVWLRYHKYASVSIHMT